MENQLLKTALYDKHVALNAKMVPFAGYLMPVQYEGINIEHQCVREAVGVFDVSHMGEFVVEGPEAEALLQKVTSNDVSKLSIGKAQYSCLPNTTSGIVDDLIIYKLEEEKFLLVVNASNIQKDWNWIERYNDFDCSLTNHSDTTSLLAIQGPRAAQAMQSLTAVVLQEIPFYQFKMGTFAGVDNVLISATGYTGSGGFEIYFDNKYASKIWEAVLDAGKDFGIKPVGLAARDTLRLEMGFCLYGNDIDDTTSTLEAGLGWITKFDKDFIQKENLLKQKSEGLQRKLVGFEMIDKGIPRKDYEILDDQQQPIGKVTSGTMSPSLQQGIGLGYVRVDFAKPETEIYIAVRNKQLKAKVVKPPFYKM
ncbi:MAG: glycine cleavage system aminomethyltransferase GcvT [Flavobacteriaceae bacterium]|nr:glycine cleavage system aminomethyltransferase GcvT [Flavobacteriaceae bacterium]